MVSWLFVMVKYNSIMSKVCKTFLFFFLKKEEFFKSLNTNIYILTKISQLCMYIKKHASCKSKTNEMKIIKRIIIQFVTKQSSVKAEAKPHYTVVSPCLLLASLV